MTGVINTAGEPDALTLGAGALWYGTTTTSIIGRVDPTTNTVLGRLELPGPSFGATAAYGFVWITDKEDNFLFQIRPT